MDSLSVLKNKPEIRFAGFDGNWEQRKCGSFATESCEKGHTGSIAKKLTVKLHANGVCEAGEITQGSDNTQYYVRHAGQFIYGKQNFFNGAIGVVPESLDKYESTKDVPAFDIDKIVDVDWFCHYMTRPEIYKPQELNCTGTGSKRFHVNSFFDMSILAPCLQEQQAIGKTFTNLNHLIILQQRKCDRLQALKKAMLEKMFPKAGSDVPEIRFAGFTDAWEQRKVGDLLIERNQQAPMSDEYPLMAFIANEGVAPKGERYDRSSLVTDTVNKLYKKTEKGDFIYSSNNLETGSIGLNKYGKACISPVYSIFEPTGIADSDFLGRRLVRKDFINAMVKWRQGVIYGQWRIHESDFLKIEITVPSVEEQRKIGAYLDQLDHLITLHQRKLQKLQECKKALLEKMFVSQP